MDFTQHQYDLMVLAESAVELAIAAFALWRGDRVVRVVALIYLALQGAIDAVEWLTPARTTYYLWVDGPGLAALIAVALLAPRPWLLWACAFKLAIVASHIGYLADARIRGLAYATALNTWLMLGCLALLWGALDAHRARRRSAAATA